MYSTSVLSLELSIQYASFKYYAKNMAMGLGASNAMFCYMTSLCKAINIIFHCFAIVLNFLSSIKLFSPSLSLSHFILLVSERKPCYHIFCIEEFTTLKILKELQIKLLCKRSPKLRPIN